MDIKEQSARVYVGLDIGQSQDPTAIVVLQHVRSKNGASRRPKRAALF
jgi:phage terminase large subunit-like protein